MKNVVKFLSTSMSNLTADGKETDKTKYYAILRVETVVVEDGFEFVSAFNGILQSTKATIAELGKKEKGFVLPEGIASKIKPATTVDTLTGEITHAYISDANGNRIINKETGNPVDIVKLELK